MINEGRTVMVYLISKKSSAAVMLSLTLDFDSNADEKRPRMLDRILTSYNSFRSSLD